MGLSVPEVALISGHKDARMLFPLHSPEGRGFSEENKLGILRLKLHPSTHLSLTTSKNEAKGSVVGSFITAFIILL